MNEAELLRLHVDRDSGLLREARLALSPNRDARPAGTEPDLVVLHNISLPPGRFGGPYIEDFFLNRLDINADAYFAEIAGLRVSSHLLVRRDGSVVQFVPFHERAWHAGESQYEGRSRCNDFSIGIEMEGTDELPYEEIQYEVVGALVAALAEAYPGIDVSRVTGHCHIAPARKTDPGPAFNWARLRGLLDSYSA
ncbi:1,6-anhydro-N-acetylmuramyl-L-alanine amidase AmpD [Granulosicoccaceae sp. 1_MG-2023]|nr:1,6-anhydro-N-acetylmuramyl-L-alanine amidase AmpD [Granulosicoccaceae sp. 1_MG-2023]